MGFNMLRYLLLLFTALSLPSFAEYQSAIAHASNRRHKEFTFKKIEYKGCTESEAKLIVHSDGKAYFSSVISAHSDDSAGQWIHLFGLMNRHSDKYLFGTDAYWSPVVQSGHPVHWKIDFTFDAGLFDQIDSCERLYNTPCGFP
jgi:hypothetical protein